MKTSMFKTAALMMAVPGLALAAPSAAAPATHSAGYETSSVWGNQTAEQSRRQYRNYDNRSYGQGYDSRYQQNSYGEPVYANTRVWQGDDGRYYCRKSNGTTGMVIGAAGGALLGREIAGRGDRTLGTILGAAGGALLGRAIQKGSSTRCR